MNYQTNHAKLTMVEGHQVLTYVDYDDELEQYMIRIRLWCGDIVVETSLGYEDEDTRNEVFQANKFDKLIRNLMKAVQG